MQGGKGKSLTNQEAHGAANLFAIYLAHFHAVPKNKKKESELRTSFLRANTVCSFVGGGGRNCQRLEANCMLLWIKEARAPRGLGWGVWSDPR